MIRNCDRSGYRAGALLPNIVVLLEKWLIGPVASLLMATQLALLRLLCPRQRGFRLRTHRHIA